MLRPLALALVAALLVLLLVGAMANWHTLPFAIVTVILLLGLLFERYVYKPIRREPPGPGWDKTAEKFADPKSGQTVVVYYNARTGERRYVAETDG